METWPHIPGYTRPGSTNGVEGASGTTGRLTPLGRDDAPVLHSEGTLGADGFHDCDQISLITGSDRLSQVKHLVPLGL